MLSVTSLSSETETNSLLCQLFRLGEDSSGPVKGCAFDCLEDGLIAMRIGCQEVFACAEVVDRLARHEDGTISWIRYVSTG
jgi:hypothetical protein